MVRLKRTKQELHDAYQREPSVEELAAELDEPVAKVREMLRLEPGVDSLDRQIGESQGTSLGELIEDRNMVTPADAAMQRLMLGEVESILHELEESEREVVRLRFGLSGRSALTLDQMGAELGVSRERVRQIEQKTLAKLRRRHEFGPARTLLDSP
jgi:RNA polymerase primary sigma factor